MRVVFAYHRHGWDRGIERKSAELAERFARHDHRIEYFCTAAEPREGSAVAFVKVPVRWGPNSLKLITFDYFARRTMSRASYDLSLSFGSVVGCDILTAESCHRAGLETVAGLQGQTAREGLNLGLADAVRLRIERANYGRRQYIRVVACSNRVRRELSEQYSVPESDVTVIPSGVDIDQFRSCRERPERARLRESLRFTPTDIVLLFVGNEFARKGLATLLRALARLGREGIHLLVCGDGKAAAYQKIARELGVGRNVRFVGHVTEIAPYFAAADVFVLPTLHEAFGLVVLEAMASGLPVVVSRVAGAAEDHLADGKEGLLLENPTDAVELAMKIEAVIGRDDLGRSLGEAGRRKAEDLTWDVCAERFLEVMAEAFEMKRTRNTGPGS